MRSILMIVGSRYSLVDCNFFSTLHTALTIFTQGLEATTWHPRKTWRTHAHGHKELFFSPLGTRAICEVGWLPHRDSDQQSIYIIR